MAILPILSETGDHPVEDSADIGFAQVGEFGDGAICEASAVFEGDQFGFSGGQVGQKSS